jgi:hypothetical protein
LSNQLISLDLFYAIEHLMPGKRTVALFRKSVKHLPVTTLPLTHYDSAAGLQLALFRHCRNYVAFTQGHPISPDFDFSGSAEQILAAESIMKAFIRGAYWWVEYHMAHYRDDWSHEQTQRWLKDLRLLVQVVIGIGNCTNAEWILTHRGPIQALTYDTHLEPFLASYD